MKNTLKWVREQGDRAESVEALAAVVDSLMLLTSSNPPMTSLKSLSAQHPSLLLTANFYSSQRDWTLKPRPHQWFLACKHDAFFPTVTSAAIGENCSHRYPRDSCNRKKSQDIQKVKLVAIKTGLVASPVEEWLRQLKAKSAHITFSKHYAACESKNARVASASLIPVLALPMVKNFFLRVAKNSLPSWLTLPYQKRCLKYNLSVWYKLRSKFKVINKKSKMEMIIYYNDSDDNDGGNVDDNINN